MLLNLLITEFGNVEHYGVLPFDITPHARLSFNRLKWQNMSFGNLLIINSSDLKQ